MSFINEVKKITKIQEKERAYAILAGDKEIWIRKDKLVITINCELESSDFFLYKNEIWATSWSQLRDYLQKHNISLPQEKIPCTTCNPARFCPCFIHCDREEQIANEQMAVA